MNTHSRTRLRYTIGGVSMASLLALAACGGTTSNQAAAGATPADNAGAFCDAIVSIDTAVSTGPGGGPPPGDPAKARAALRAFGAELEPLLAKAEKNSPKPVANDVSLLAQTSERVLKTGDPSAFGSPRVRRADDNVDRWMMNNCGHERMNVTAVDHEFQGLPKNVAAGPIALTLSNKGTEVHELVLLRINDDVSESLEALLKLPEKKAMRMVKPAGAAFVPPGQSDTVFLDVTTGRYGVVCFTPSGTTSPQQEGHGPPHFVKGMSAELTVS